MATLILSGANMTDQISVAILGVHAEMFPIPGGHLGMDAEDGHADFVWREHDRPDEIGRTVWSLFPADTDYFGPARPAFMVNYRVSNLDRMLAQLRQKGVSVEKIEDYDYGRFAWITDPEGNRLELWEPKSK